MTDKLLTMEEAAERLRTTPRHVRRLVFEIVCTQVTKPCLGAA
jgi:hypothetical protein